MFVKIKTVTSILTLNILFIGKAQSKLKCYSCSYTVSDSDQSCLTITDNTQKVNCDYKYCTITRQEYLDPPGEIASFVRGCTDKPIFLNTEITDIYYRTFYRACTQDLCNIGDGIQSVAGGNASPYPEYIGPNLLVPGTGSAANVKISVISLIIANIFMYLA